MGKKSKGKSKGKGDGKLRKKDRKRAAGRAVRAADRAVRADASASPPSIDGMALRSGRPSGSRSRRTIDATELAARLASLSTVLQRHLARVDSGDGLTRARLSALALLVLGGPRTLGELAAAERVRPPTMTRLVHAMETDGLVVRERNPADGRSIIIRATNRGERQLERGRAQQIAPLAESISDLDRGERLLLEDGSDVMGRLLRGARWDAAEPVE